MSYKKICSLCNGNGYIKVKVKEKYETKQCWLCESTGEKKPMINTECVLCGCTPKPDEWSTQIENACFDCA